LDDEVGAPTREASLQYCGSPADNDLDGGELRGNSRAKAGVTRPMTKQSASFNANPRARRGASSLERAREERRGTWQESSLRVCW